MLILINFNFQSDKKFSNYKNIKNINYYLKFKKLKLNTQKFLTLKKIIIIFIMEEEGNLLENQLI